VLWIDVPTWDGKWRCARLPPRLGQRNEPFRKLSAGACTASEGDLAAESRPAPHRVSASADFHLLVLTMRSPDSAPCLGLGDETHPFASSPQVPARPLKVTWLQRVDLRPVSVFRVSRLSPPRSDDALACLSALPGLGRRNAPFRKLSAGAFLAAEGDMAAENPGCIVLASPLNVPGRTRSGEDHMSGTLYASS